MVSRFLALATKWIVMLLVLAKMGNIEKAEVWGRIREHFLRHVLHFVEVLQDIQRKNLGIQLNGEVGTREGSSCQCELHEHTDANGSHGCG